MAENVLEITESNFETEVLQSEVPVLVDFWAPWCGPCKMMMPAIESLATSVAGSAKVAKVNTDDNRELAARYKVEALPTVIVFKGGEEVNRSIGLADEKKFTEMLG